MLMNMWKTLNLYFKAGTERESEKFFIFLIEIKSRVRDENMIVKTTKKEIEKIFADSKETAEVFFKLYELVLPEARQPGIKIDYRKYKISKKFNEFLFDSCVEFDNNQHKGNLELSFLWMNAGFSTGKNLKDFEIEILS